MIGWAGMRGAVTLAAALALPLTLAGGKPYPRQLFLIGIRGHRGDTGRAGSHPARGGPAAEHPGDEAKEDALAEAAVQHEASRAGRERLDEVAEGRRTAVVERLRGWPQPHQPGLGAARRQRRETPSLAYARLRQEMIDAEREVFRVARDNGRIPEEVLAAHSATWTWKSRCCDGRATVSCAHLTGAGTTEPTVTDACPECVAVGNDDWVHLRRCVECGQVGCCDSSPYRTPRSTSSRVGTR